MTATADLTCATYDSPLGPVLLAARGDGLAGLWFEGQKHGPADTTGWRRDADHPVLVRAMRQLDEYFAGRRAGFDLALDLSRGTAFQARVWQALQRIPTGATVSYSALATAIGAPAAVRAVGAAVGRNPVSIVVPCHRVLGAGGALTGYAGGLERKNALLRLEGALH